MSKIDVAAIRSQVADHLWVMGFEPRGADPSDFQRGTDSSLRFKVGTSYGEVAVQVLVNNKKDDVIRVVSEAQVPEALRSLSLITDIYQGEAR